MRHLTSGILCIYLHESPAEQCSISMYSCLPSPRAQKESVWQVCTVMTYATAVPACCLVSTNPLQDQSLPSRIRRDLWCWLFKRRLDLTWIISTLAAIHVEADSCHASL